MAWYWWVAGYFAAVKAHEILERRAIYNEAAEYARSRAKPLLVVSPPPSPLYHGCGDVTIDVSGDSLRRVGCPGSQYGNISRLPFFDKEFGAAYAAHVLEHLPTVNDARQALGELNRVADKVFVASPHVFSVLAHLYPEHHLWVMGPQGNQIMQRSV